MKQNPELIILCIEDEADVREAILRDLAPFEARFRLEGVGSAGEASQYLQSLDPGKQRVALIFCDHVMPGQRGVEFMAELEKAQTEVVRGARKVLFTGQAGHEDTIEAINRARIHHYLPKPWEVEALHELTRRLLTDFVLEMEIPPLPYMAVLDQGRVAESIHDRPSIQDV